PIGKALQDLVESDAALEPRERVAQAVVNAVAEGEVLTDIAPDVEAVWILVLTVVTIRGTSEAHHGTPGRHDLAVPLDVARHVTGDVRCRRLESPERLDCVRNERSVPHERAPLR